MTTDDILVRLDALANKMFQDGNLGPDLETIEADADDYLGKPFEPRELLLRIAALLRADAGADRNHQTEE